MDSLPKDAAPTSDDLSALAWVSEELRKSLELAHKSLHRCLSDATAVGISDMDALDPAVLRTARQQVHQAVGVLELAGLPAGATVLRASEAVIQKLISRPQMINEDVVREVERASFALLDYIAKKLAGKSVSAMAMFHQYEALVSRAGAGMARPTDLWGQDWPGLSLEVPLAPPEGLLPRSPDARTVEDFEMSLLKLFRRNQAADALELAALCASLACDAVNRHASRECATWMLASGFLEALAGRYVPLSIHAKRVLSSLLGQLRVLNRGQDVPSDRLASELLFFCAQAGEVPEKDNSVLSRVRQTFGLARHQPVNLSASSLGRFDPAWVAQALKRVAGAKDGWSAVAGGELLRLPGLNEQFALVSDSLRRLFIEGDVLATALTEAVQKTALSGTVPPPGLAMEVATSLLYMEASLEDGEFDQPEQQPRLQRLAQRIQAATQGLPVEPLEAWMEDLYRRVSDRHTIGSVVQELRSTLTEAEKHIDLFFRQPADRTPLASVPAILQSMRGVLAVLDLDQAAQASVRMRDDVDHLLLHSTDLDAAAQSGVFDRLASNLSALGFLIDLTAVQPQLAKSLFVFDTEAGLLSPVMGREKQDQRPAVPTAEDSALEPQPDQGDSSVVHGEATASATSQASQSEDRMPSSLPADDFLPVQVDAPSSDAVLAEDDEMREIFLEEAREVIDTARASLQDLTQQPDDLASMTTVRRAFHTLKGSSRMVGLNEYGEAAWACEQLYNAWLAGQEPASPDLLAVTQELLSHFASWTDAVAEGQTAGWHHQPVTRVAEALRLRGERIHIDQAMDGSQAERSIDPGMTLSSPGEIAPTREVAVTDGLEIQFESPAEPSDLDLGVQDLSVPEVVDFDLPPQLTLDDESSEASLPSTAEMPLVNIADFGIDLDLTAPLVPPSESEVPILAEDQSGQPFSVDIGEPKHVVDLEDADPTLAGNLYEESHPALDEPSPAESVAAEPIDIPLLDVEDVTQVEQSDLLLADSDADEQFKQIGDLRIGIPLFNIFLNEADEQSRRLSNALNEWALELEHPLRDEVIALAHSLAGNSGTVGYAELSKLARLLEHALMRSQALGAGDADASSLFIEAAEEIRRLLHQFAAGFLKSPPAELMARLEDYEHEASRRYEARILDADKRLEEFAAEEEPGAKLAAAPQAAPFGLPEFKALEELPAAAARGAAGTPRQMSHVWDEEEIVDAEDSVDLDLFPVFEEEALELLPQLGAQVRAWLETPEDLAAGAACMRTLHTFKGGARLAGAMRLGELAHRLESAIEHLLATQSIQRADIAPLESRVDRLLEVFEALRHQDATAYEAGVAQAETSASVDLTTLEVESSSSAQDQVEHQADQLLTDAPAEAETRRRVATREVLTSKLTPVDWSSLVAAPWEGSQRVARDAQQNASQAAVRVRPQVLDRLVNHAGEVSIARSRLSSQVGQIRSSINDLTENLERLRQQLRDIELQADTQMSTRMEAARAASQDFDPLEFDRYTRFQELTRMMAESVNDVATVQRTLQRSLETAEDQLAVQARLMRDLQDDLLRTRMVEFEGLSDRLYRVVRQAAKETGKQVRLDIVGGAIEVDRGVLERLTGAFEHLLRNCISHGIEMPDVRLAAGKEPAGLVTVALRQEGNEVAIEFRDDGAGLNLPRIRQRAVSMGLLGDDQSVSDAELAQFIFMSGFSTFDKVTELAGRGIGMDVVRSEINAMGGRIETATAKGRGTSFTLMVPLTTAVTKVVMMRCGGHTVAVPTHLIELVKRAKPEELARAYEYGSYVSGDQAMPFYWLGALLNYSPRSHESGRTMPLVIIRSAQQRVALHVDEVLGNQEVVVKNLGVQMSRMPGLAGMTLLASGAVALIYNPVALATVFGAHAHSLTAHVLAGDKDVSDGGAKSWAPDSTSAVLSDAPLAPLVLVVDDSLTVRRVTQRLLTREGYRVALAKDGLEALEALSQERPAVVLSDIEMPRMDGFDLVRNIRADTKISDIPIIMITSRIAQKHRDYAEELGVNHYLGKPYGEDELLELVGRYAARQNSAHA